MPTLRAQRYLLTGLLTFIPLWVTWLVFRFVLGMVASAGQPLVSAAGGALALLAPTIGAPAGQRWLVYGLALLLTLVALYLIGLLANLVVGQRLFAAFERLLQRVPLARTIYAGTRSLMASMRSRPSGTQRVVLVEFPRPGMLAVGFVTRSLPPARNGRRFAAVYIPTAPNPTGGYLEFVPLERLIATDWTVDQAMTFVISGGAVVPAHMPTTAPAP
ncbi:MAG TPA: DUF502 domain-containing protein [Rhodanobacteraceae bacterium]|nr:DUF502 domain-containing protein [Rhodanobacteraceae bacterium]